MATEVNTGSFEEAVLKSDIPVLVDFWATWCGPCRMMGPVVDELSTELEGKVKIFKMNVDNSKDIADKYEIMSIPNFALFKNGECVAHKIGACSKEDLKAFANS